MSTPDTPGLDPSADPERLRTALTVANIPTLQLVLVQMTGDRRWVQEPYLPTRARGASPNDTGGLEPELQDEVRRAAFEAITAWLCAGGPSLPSPPPDDVVEILSVAMGEEIPLEYGPMIVDHLTPRDFGARPTQSTPLPEGFSALVVGAGASGIGAAIMLAERGIDYRVVERNEGIGGTWLENRYPGVGVDTPSHLYSYSFAKHDWPLYFSKGRHLAAYLRKVAEDFGVTPNIDFRTSVVQAEWDEADQVWRVQLLHGDGQVEHVVTNLLISAVGLFNTPSVPYIEGLDTFKGPSFHTATWPEEVVTEGKRVGVIGTGASAMQIVPTIADSVSDLVVFQRTAQWAAPFDLLDAEVPDDITWLMRTVPPYEAWYRVRLGWTFNDRTFAALQRDPNWPHPDRAVNEINDGYRRFFTRYIESELGDRTDLLPQMLPTYPPYAKRMLLDHGWFRTFRKPNVHLVTDGITRVTPTGVLTDDGTHHELDVIVLSTGWNVIRFISSMDVRGREGTSLRDVWGDDDARAYLGTFVHGFPNLVTLYGPNLQPGHGGSFLHLLEWQLTCALGVLEAALERGASSFEVKESVQGDYNTLIDDANERMIWTHPGVDNYYRNTRGRVVANLAMRVVDFWRLTHEIEPESWEFGFRVGAQPAEVSSGLTTSAH